MTFSPQGEDFQVDSSSIGPNYLSCVSSEVKSYLQFLIGKQGPQQWPVFFWRLWTLTTNKLKRGFFAWHCFFFF